MAMEGQKSKAIMERNLTKFSIASQHYISSSPALARFYMFQAEKTRFKLGNPGMPTEVVCQYCYTTFQTGNHTIKFIPKMKANKTVKKLIRKKERQLTLNKFQQAMLDLYRKATNRMVICCSTCGMQTFIAGENQQQRDKRKSSMTGGDKGVKEVKPTKSQLKRLKKKMARSSLSSSFNSSILEEKERALQAKKISEIKASRKASISSLPSCSISGSDSGLDVSLSSSQATRSTSSFDSVISGPKTSTPVLPRKNLKIGALFQPQNLFLSSTSLHGGHCSLSSSGISSASSTSSIFSLGGSTSGPCNKKNRKSQNHNILQQMLQNDKRKKQRNARNSPLLTFLETL